MKKLLIFSFALFANTIFFHNTASAQEVETAETSLKFETVNSVQAEIFGHGLFYSINYERFIINGSRWKTSVQLGLAYYPPATNVREVWIPVLVNQLYSFNQHHLEGGMGYIVVNEAIPALSNGVMTRAWDGFITARIGYRYQKPGGRFLFRLAFTPIIEYRDIDELHPVGGMALGYTF